MREWLTFARGITGITLSSHTTLRDLRNTIKKLKARYPENTSFSWAIPIVPLLVEHALSEREDRLNDISSFVIYLNQGSDINVN